MGLLQELRSYGGVNLGSTLCCKFSAPPAAKLYVGYAEVFQFSVDSSTPNFTDSQSVQRVAQPPPPRVIEIPALCATCNTVGNKLENLTSDSSR